MFPEAVILKLEIFGLNIEQSFGAAKPIYNHELTRENIFFIIFLSNFVFYSILKDVNEIVIRLHNLEQILVPPGSLYYGKLFLNQEAEDLIVGEIAFNHEPGPIHIRIFLPEPGAAKTKELTNGIHQHFLYRKRKSERQIKEIIRTGWRSFFIAAIFISILVPLVILTDILLPQDKYLIPVREIFIILGWVALWRPAEYLLYEWRPFKKEVQLFRKLEKCTVDIVPYPSSTAKLVSLPK